MKSLCLVLVLCGTTTAATAPTGTDAELSRSLYLQRPPDSLAITPAGLVGNGKADDSDALQRAIDRAADTTGTGIVFLLAGRYRVTHTLHLW